MKGRVLGQRPRWGRRRAHGAKVSLVVGKGPKKTTTGGGTGGGTGGDGGGGGQGGGGGGQGGGGGTVSGLPTLGPIIPRQLPPYIAYRAIPGVASGLWLINPDGSDAHQIGPPGAFDPVWSPDASEILYGAPASPNDNLVTDDAYVMNADGSDQRPIMPSSGFMWDDGDFQWSPDGKQLVFTQYEEMGHGVRIANADGTDSHPIPIPSGWSGSPSFSPDGSYIAFDSVGDQFELSPVAADYNIYVVKTDGSGLQQLTHDGGATDPSWSPDGNSIIYSCDFDSSGLPHGICEITRSEPTPQTLYSDETRILLRPTWNASGTKILLTIEQTNGGAGEIALMSPSGGTPVEITSPPASNWWPDW